MSLEKQLKKLFPTIEIIPYTYSVNSFVRNNRKYKVLVFYRVLVKCGKETHLIWIYITKTKYIINYGYTFQTIILDKKEKYKVFQIISCFVYQQFYYKDVLSKA